MVKEGVAPALIEKRGQAGGDAAGDRWQLTEETSLDLGAKIAKATRRRWARPMNDTVYEVNLRHGRGGGRLGRKPRPGSRL